MITIKTGQELANMRQACKITAAARALAGEMVRPGITTREIDKAVHDFIVSQGAKPSFLNYHGFPASTCISVNSTVIHGIPGKYVLQEGDIVSVDVGAYYKGFHGDCAATWPCGTVSAEAMRLIDVTKQSFFEGIRFAKKDTACPISPTPFKRMWSLTVFQLFAASWDTEWADNCMRSRKFRILCPLTGDPDCFRA